MIMKSLTATVAGLLLLACCASAEADTWEKPTPKIYASRSGDVGCKILPTGKELIMFRSSQAELFKLDESGKQIVARRFVLVNIPHHVIVVGKGDYLVTLDTYGRLGFDHAITIYDKKGQLIADLDLEDFLTAKEIDNVPHSVSSRHWKTDANIRVGYKNELLYIDLAGGVKISIELKTGEVLRRSH